MLTIINSYFKRGSGVVESVGKLGHCLWLVEARCSVSQKLVGCWDKLAVLVIKII